MTGRSMWSSPRPTTELAGGVEQDYARALPLTEASSPDLFLAYVMNGDPLPPQHGAPLRLLPPGWYGIAHVKWLVRITVLEHRFNGFQNTTAYRIKRALDEDGEPVTRIRPRALLRPPGFPDFQTRTRVVEVGDHEPSVGRAWSGWAPITAVEVSVDGGLTWSDATLDPSVDRYAWRRWQWRWRVETPGRYELCARAIDAAGNVQPDPKTGISKPWPTTMCPTRRRRRPISPIIPSHEHDRRTDA